MKILLIMVGIYAIGLANAYFSKKVTCDFGANIGKNYMREQWGIDTD